MKLKFKLILFLVFIVISALSFKFKGDFYPTSQTNSSKLAYLENSNLNFSELSSYFQKLSEEEGALNAYLVLKQAKLPPNTDLHLLGHVVGDELYKQQGLDGIVSCTQDFRNACSHSIVIRHLMKNGTEGLAGIADACSKAPGGKGAYTMCHHGLGHGVLAYTGYNLDETVRLCQKTNTPQYNNQEGAQCVGGAIMELISGGGHNHQLWSTQRVKYLDSKKPLEICSHQEMTETSKIFCYTYITPFLWEAVGADMSSPQAKDFAKAFPICEQIAESAIQYKKTCYGSFGKDFLGLAMNRDIRDVSQITDNQMAQIINWCGLAKSDLGTSECLLHAMSSMYWGGENDRSTSIRFCGLIQNSKTQDSCYQTLTDLVKIYIDDKNYHQSFCTEIPTKYLSYCKQKLS